MIYLIVGENELLGKKELAKLTKASDDLNLKKFRNECRFEDIKNEILTQPFLADKKIVLLEKLFQNKDKETEKRIAELLKDIPGTCDVIFYEDTKPDSRTVLYKTICEKGQLISCGQIEPGNVPKLIEEKVKSLGASITKGAVERLAAAVGTDTTRLENEIQKLASYNPEITEESVEKLVVSDFNESIFQFMDALSEKNVKKSVLLLDGFLEDGQNEQYLLSMIARQIRNLLTVKDLSGGMNEAAIVKETKFHPFVVKKTLSQARRFSLEELYNIHSEIIKTDEAIKTGQLEPKIALTKLILFIVK